MGIDNSLTTLARKLDPYIRSIVKSMIGTTGTGGSVATSGYTIIRGTQIPEIDASGARAINAIDLGIYASESSTSYGVKTGYTGILGGLNNKIESTAGNSVILGGSTNIVSGVYSTILGGYECIVSGASSVVAGDLAKQENPFNYTLSYYIDTPGDGQVATYTKSDYIVMSDTWQYIGEVYNTAIDAWKVGSNTYTAWTFSALVVGTTLELGAVFSYKIEGLVKRGATATPTIVNFIVTTIHSDVATFEIQPAIVDDYFRIQVKDTDNGGDGVTWVVRLDTAEVSHNAAIDL